ncbi:Hypothetical protein CulFRC58_1969 [Corynebacterium ulcerans FRC58]|uniref:Transposase n=1 Tax=Corynebacterium ulcerans FRC58 TaxID=1408268 RepID=A0ABM5U3U3_CORUL|nr:Hypothetical protein CulFRC58_1969 [Corynebacterium ulcerans FRC58]
MYAEEKTYKVNRAKGKTMKSRISQIVNEQFMFPARRRLSLSLDCFFWLIRGKQTRELGSQPPRLPRRWVFNVQGVVRVV